MKILICIPCLLIGGTEIQTLNLAEALISSGHHVTVACYFEYNKDMVRNFERIGCKVFLMNAKGVRINGIQSVKFLYKGLKRVVEEFKPDITHVQYMAPGAIPIILLKILGVKKVISTAHTSAKIYSNLRLVHFIQKFCVKVFTCISENAEKSFFGSSTLYTNEYILKKHNHFTIYNALPSYIQIRETIKHFNSTFTVGVVSRLEPIKGMDLIIPAFAETLKKFPNLKLLIVGDGSLRKLMEQQIDTYQIKDHVEWAGSQGYNTIQSYYDRIDVLCMPSRSEGFGLTALEGMARGCVLVASNVDGLSEVVTDGHVGLLHQTENVESMVSAMTQLLSDSKSLSIMSKNAIKRAQLFTLQKYSNLFNDLYSKL